MAAPPSLTCGVNTLSSAAFARPWVGWHVSGQGIPAVLPGVLSGGSGPSQPPASHVQEADEFWFKPDPPRLPSGGSGPMCSAHRDPWAGALGRGERGAGLAPHRPGSRPAAVVLQPTWCVRSFPPQHGSGTSLQTSQVHLIQRYFNYSIFKTCPSTPSKPRSGSVST